MTIDPIGLLSVLVFRVSITQYTQKEPVRFGEKKLYLSCINGGPKVKSVKINGKIIKVKSPDAVVLIYKELPAEAKVEIVTTGGWGKEEYPAGYPLLPELLTDVTAAVSAPVPLPDSLQNPHAILTGMDKFLAEESGSEYDISFVKAALETFRAYQNRSGMEVGPGYFRPIDPERKEAMVRLYAKSAIAMYRGYEKRMEDYSLSGDLKQKRIASFFFREKKERM